MLPESLQMLVDAGTVPRELRLERWAGPTLFTSELHDGDVRRLDALRSLETNEDNPLVLGTARETDGYEDEEPAAYGAFCLTDDGRVVLVDLELGTRRFVASGPSELFASLALFAREWPAFRKLKGEEIPAFLAWLKRSLEAVDPRIGRDRQDYWSAWLKLLGEQASRTTKPSR